MIGHQSNKLPNTFPFSEHERDIKNFQIDKYTRKDVAFPMSLHHYRTYTFEFLHLPNGWSAKWQMYPLLNSGPQDHTFHLLFWTNISFYHCSIQNWLTPLLMRPLKFNTLGTQASPKNPCLSSIEIVTKTNQLFGKKLLFIFLLLGIHF